MKPLLLVCERPPAIDLTYMPTIREQYQCIFLDERKQSMYSEVRALILRTSTQATPDFLAQFPALQDIYKIGVGTDNIAMEYCAKHTITVHRSQGSNASAVADLTLRGMVLLSRNISQYMFHTQNNISTSRFDYMGQDLSSQTIGIIGFGAIGKAVYQRLRAFGVQAFVVYDPYLSQDDLAGFPDVKKSTDLLSMAQSVDIISIHVPLVNETYNMINAEFFAHAPSNLKLINMSRGGIVDEHALHTFLSQHPNAGAYLDVWINEPKKTQILQTLEELPNFFCTPHLGAMTAQANENMHKIFPKP